MINYKRMIIQKNAIYILKQIQNKLMIKKSQNMLIGYKAAQKT